MHLSNEDAVVEEPPEKIRLFFLDSGAHSLYKNHSWKEENDNRYTFYETDEFWNYVDDYADFVKKHKDSIDYYANVDVILNPELSWKSQKYLEDVHKLSPVPVIHMGADKKWLIKHLKEGYDYIGLGGVALEGTRTSYVHWADSMFNILCNTKDKTPSCKVHGFAMTAYASLVRYPWWSVDSTSWAKAGGFGKIFMPKKINGQFEFVPSDTTDWNLLRKYEPYALSCSVESPAAKKKNQSYLNISREAQSVVEEWLAIVDVPIGSVDENNKMIEWGIVSHHSARKIANIKFFDMLTKALPEWPWPFKATLRTGFGFV